MKNKNTLLPCIAALASLTLGACSLAPTVPERAVYDLGPAPAAPAQSGAGTLAWRIADVTSPPWLAGDGIAYRLNFQQTQRLEHYRDSAWAAPPAALLTQRLHEQLAAAPACASGPPALLAVSLDEFEQVFSGPSSSQVVLRVHATLWPANATAPTQQRHWRLERPASTPDALGAVRGLAQAVNDWLPELGDWLTASACH
jgi:cholesterol transport system auxiliary component